MNHPSPDALFDLLAGGLADAKADALRAHLSACDACRARLEELASMDALSSATGRAIAGAPGVGEAPPEVTARIREEVARIATGGATARPVLRRAAVVAGLLAAAAAILLVVRGGGGALLGNELDGALLREQAAPLYGKVRGVESREAELLREAKSALREGRWKERAGRARGCSPEERRRSGLFDDQGRLRLFARLTADSAELHLYDEAGAEAMAATSARGAERLAAAEPLGRTAAEKALSAPACAIER